MGNCISNTLGLDKDARKAARVIEKRAVAPGGGGGARGAVRDGDVIANAIVN